MEAKEAKKDELHTIRTFLVLATCLGHVDSIVLLRPVLLRHHGVDVDDIPLTKFDICSSMRTRNTTHRLSFFYWDRESHETVKRASLLRLACMQGVLAVVDYLTVFTKAAHCFGVPLCLACQAGHTDVVAYLIERHGVSMAVCHGLCLSLAIRRDRTDTIAYLTTQLVLEEQKRRKERKGRWERGSAGHPAELQTIKDRALVSAAAKGRVDIMRFLLSRGARPSFSSQKALQCIITQTNEKKKTPYGKHANRVAIDLLILVGSDNFARAFCGNMLRTAADAVLAPLCCFTCCGCCGMGAFCRMSVDVDDDDTDEERRDVWEWLDTDIRHGHHLDGIDDAVDNSLLSFAAPPLFALGGCCVPQIMTAHMRGTWSSVLSRIILKE